MSKKRIGKPTKYREEFNEQARKLCLLGHTNEGLALFFEVSASTISNWMTNHPDFLAAVKAGRVIADANVAVSLYERAIGYSHKSEKLFQFQGEIIRVETIEHYPPDIGACKFWLTNRQPEKWREKVVVESEDNLTMVPKEELDAIHARNLEKQKQMMAVVMGRAARLGIASFIEGNDEHGLDEAD